MFIGVAKTLEHSLLIYEREFSSFFLCSSIGNCYQSNVDLADDSNDRRELRNSSRERKHIEGRKKGLVSWKLITRAGERKKKRKRKESERREEEEEEKDEEETCSERNSHQTFSDVQEDASDRNVRTWPSCICSARWRSRNSTTFQWFSSRWLYIDLSVCWNRSLIVKKTSWRNIFF